MKILISPKWFMRHAATMVRVEANVYTAKYFQHPYVSLNISQPSSRPRGPQAQLRVDIGPAEARELAAQLLRHAATIEAEAAADASQGDSVVVDSNAEGGCYTNSCYFGRHEDCHDVTANCCDCSCHLGIMPERSPYEQALESAEPRTEAI